MMKVTSFLVEGFKTYCKFYWVRNFLKLKTSRVVYFHSYKIRNLLNTYVNRFGTHFTINNNIKYYGDVYCQEGMLSEFGGFPV